MHKKTWESTGCKTRQMASPPSSPSRKRSNNLHSFSLSFCLLSCEEGQTDKVGGGTEEEKKKSREKMIHKSRISNFSFLSFFDRSET